MKRRIKSYTFNTSTKQITITDPRLTVIDPAAVLVIEDMATLSVLYNPLVPTTAISASGLVISLNASISMSGLSNSDPLLIYYDDPDYEIPWNDIYDDSNKWISVNQAKSMILTSGGLEGDTIGVAQIRPVDAWQNVPAETQSTSAQTIQAAPGVNTKSINITDLTVSTDGGAACTVTIQDDTSGTPKIIEIIRFGTTPQSLPFRYGTPKSANVGQALKYVCSSATPKISVSGAGRIL